MTNSEEKLQRLFDPFEVKWMVQTAYNNDTKCICVPFFDARMTADRLNHVMGMTNRQDKIETTAGKTVCTIGLRINGEWLWRSDMGDTKDGQERSTSSSAFKRAGSKRGIGKFIYDIPPQFLDYTKTGKYGHAVANGKSLKNPDDLSAYCNSNMGKLNISIPELQEDELGNVVKSAEKMEKDIDKKIIKPISEDQQIMIDELLQIIPDFAMTKPENFDEAENYIVKIKKEFKQGILTLEHKPDADFIKQIFGDDAKEILSELKKK